MAEEIQDVVQCEESDFDEATSAISAEELALLWRQYRTTRSEDLRNRLIEHFWPLVRYNAERLKTKLPSNVDLMDMISAGVFGLMDAINKFDPDYGSRFESFCMMRIRGAILDDLRDGDWVPRQIRTRAHQHERALKELTIRFNRAPTDEEVATYLGLTHEEYLDLREQLEVKSQLSVDAYLGNDGVEPETLRLDMLEDKREYLDPVHTLQLREVQEVFLRGLSQKARVIMQMYYSDHLTMKEIGAVLGLSESRVSQIHAQALEFLKKKVADLGLGSAA